MSDLHTQAALIWAQAHAAAAFDPVLFGHDVALVARACLETTHHAGDERATAAALAALSVRPETLQALAHLASLRASPITAAAPPDPRSGSEASPPPACDTHPQTSPGWRV